MKKLWYKLRVKWGILPRRYAVILTKFGIHPTEYIVIETYDRSKVVDLALYQHSLDGQLGVISDVQVEDVTFNEYFNEEVWTNKISVV